MSTAQFPVIKQLNEFDVGSSSIPTATFDYLASLELIVAKHRIGYMTSPRPSERRSRNLKLPS